MGANNLIRLLIGDDHTLFAEGLAEILAQEADMEVVGEARSGSEVVSIVEQEAPDIVVMDAELRGPGAEDTVREIQRHVPATRVMILTMHDEPWLVERLLDAGQRAYVIKGVTREELLAAIRGVTRDDEHSVISVSRETVARLRSRGASPLSRRELEVLTAVSAGLGNAQIASRLFIAEGTVKSHLTNIYIKLEVATRMNAINKAIAIGLISPKEFGAQMTDGRRRR